MQDAKNPEESLIIHFKLDKNALRMLEDVNTKLGDILIRIDQSIVEAYSEWTILNYFAGRKFYYLTLFLENKLSNLDDRQEVISTVGEAFNAAELKYFIDKQHNYYISDDLEKRVSSVKDAMRYISNKVTHSLRVDNKEDVPLFSSANNRVRIAYTIGISGSNKPAAEINEYEAILKITVARKCTELTLSQILYCNENMNPYELLVFLHRALRDPFKRIYFLINTDAMPSELIVDLKRIVEEITSDNIINSNLIIFINKLEYVDALQSSNSFCSCDEELMDTIRTGNN